MTNSEHVGERIEYDPASNSYSFSHDWTATSLSTTVASALERITDTPTDQLTPLYAVVDPDGLDELFRTGPDGVPCTEGWVRFPYATYEITVHASGEVVIADTSEDGRAERGR